MTKELLKKVRILDPVSGTDKIGDVLIEEGEIRAIESNIANISPDTRSIDGRGLILAPGLVDLYSHSGEPGHEERETLSSLTAAATAGGFTRLVILPDTTPPLDNPASIDFLRQKAQNLQKTYSPHLYIWGGLTVNLEGKQMNELAELATCEGVVGFSDGYSIENLGLLRRVLEYVKPLAMPVALFASNKQIKGNGVMREGAASIRYGLPGNPAISESVAIASILELVAAIGAPVHLMRVSTARGVELIADAKSRGVPVTASTTWMHLLFDSNAIASYDPNLRLEPPLGNKEDVQALITGVKEGIIDAIAIDHSPYTYEEKTVSFGEAPPGAIGLELALPLLWQRFVETGEWSALELWQAMSTRPQLCLQQKPLAVNIGEKTELVLFDPEQTWTVEGKNLRSRCANTPWLNKEIKGKVIPFLTDYALNFQGIQDKGITS
jgi:dihydroorotase